MTATMELTELQADYIRQLYLTPGDELIKVKPWRKINEDVYEACRLLDQRLSWYGTELINTIVSNKRVVITYSYLPYITAPEAERKRSTVGFSFDHIPDPMVWQLLLHCKYPVPIFIEPRHPLNGKNVVSLGLGVEVL